MARYIWDRERREFVAPEDFARARVVNDKRADFPTPQVMGDIKAFQSPIDRTWITSRPQVREHEKKHNVRQVGNDLKPEDFRC